MRKTLILPILVLSLNALCQEWKDDRGEHKPYNLNHYTWSAKSAAGTEFVGEADATRRIKTLDHVQNELDRLCKAGKCEDGERFEVVVRWKEDMFIDVLVAHKDRIVAPKELPRGPDKKNELPRGPTK